MIYDYMIYGKKKKKKNKFLQLFCQGKKKVGGQLAFFISNQAILFIKFLEITHWRRCCK